VLELVAVLRAGKTVRIEDLPAALRQRHEAQRTARGTRSTIEVSLAQPLRESQAQIIAAVLEHEGGNRSHAARRLGISVRTIQRHLDRS
jgi:DNA-binding NtrC family response regulator